MSDFSMSPALQLASGLSSGRARNSREGWGHRAHVECYSLVVPFNFRRRNLRGGSARLRGSRETLLALLGRTPRGSCNRTLLRRVLSRFFEGSVS